MFGNVQRVDREPAPQVVRLLGGGVERVAVARGVVVAEIGARLDRIGRQAVVVEAELHDLRRRSHRRLGLAAVAALDLEHEVAAEPWVHQRRAQRHRVARRGDRGQRVVRDLHGLGRVLSGEPGVGHDRGDDVADMVHLVACEGRAGRRVHGTAVAERHRMHDGELAVPGLGPIVGGQCQQHTGPRGRGPRRHRDDPRMGMGAAHKGAPGEPGQSDVIDVKPPPADEAGVLAAAQRLADVAVAGVLRVQPHPAPSVRQPKTGASPPVPLRAASLRQK
jgi:hypothetical protein